MHTETEVTIVRADEAEVLNVLGTQLRLVCPAEKTKQAWSLMEAVLPKYSGPPPHFHPWDEAYYIVKGNVRFSLNGNELFAGPGDFVLAPGGTVHGFEGISEEDARMLIFDAPAHSAAFFREIDQQVRQIPDDLAKMPAIGARHNLQFVMPE
ncbi:MAG: cupin domain-containing protein [Telluria sp.]